jgi:hypothetical protein
MIFDGFRASGVGTTLAETSPEEHDMLSNRAALAALILVGVVAAGAGAYIANRAHPAPSLALSNDVTLPASGAVTETENSLAPVPAPTPIAAAPAVSTPVETAAKPVSTSRSASASASRSGSNNRQRREPAERQSGGATSSSNSPQTSATNIPVAPSVEPVESTSVERRPAAPEPPQKQFEELTIPADSVVGLQIENAISSQTAKVEDQVRARVARDVKVHDQVAIPAGARAEGAVTLVDKGGKLKDQARLGIRFHTIVLADGTRLPINTETIYREGDSPARESAAKIGGGAVGGAVLGAILGGKKGAVIGSTVGAGAGSAAVMASEPNAVSVPAGSTVTVRMSAPANVTVEK